MTSWPTLREVRAFAQEAHGEQRYGTRPYVVHLDAVADVLRRFGFDAPGGLDAPVAPSQRGARLLAAGYLHDVLEDTAVGEEALAAFIGREVTALVDAVTKAPGGRKAGLAATLDKIAAHPDGPALKLGDRIANVEACIADRSPLFAMYQREWDVFRARLRRVDEEVEMWRHLDRLMRTRL